MTPVAIITGASSGIGANAAGRLAAEGWDIGVVGRNPERTRAIAERVGGTPFLADFDRLDDVRSLAEQLRSRYDRIDVLANNAGGLLHTRALSADGFERTLQHNHLAPFLLTNLLLDVLTESDARVIGTASVANRVGQLRLDDLQWERRPWLGGWRAYGTSKIAVILFAAELTRRTSLDSYSFHPGYVSTSFGAESGLVKIANTLSGGRLAIPAEQGATPLVHLIGAETVEAPSGTYFDGLKPGGKTNPAARDAALARGLWEISSRLVGLKG